MRLAGVVVLVAAILLLLSPDPLFNMVFKDRITATLQDALPAYAIRLPALRVSVWRNYIECDSIQVNALDSSARGSIGALRVTGIHWWRLLPGIGPASRALAGAVLEAQDLLLVLPISRYELRCRRFRLSVPDSDMVAETLTVRPTTDDPAFFAESPFRKTRMNFAARRTAASGVTWSAVLEPLPFRMRQLVIDGVDLDVLINKEKPVDRGGPAPRPVNAILAPLKEAFRCESVDMTHGVLKYAERFEAGSRPAVLTFNDIGVGARLTGGQGDGDDTFIVRGQGNLMNAGGFDLLMAIPLSAPPWTFRYSGSLRAMDLQALNPFLEVSEGMRFTSGRLERAVFEINVVAGSAGGSVRALYRGLSIAAINTKTGSEGGVWDGIASFLANRVMLRTDNVPDASGKMKIGRVRYQRRHDDPFFGFSWFALRSGVQDVVGF